MSFILDEPNEDILLRRNEFALTNAGYLQTAGARFEESFSKSPTPSIARYLEQLNAEYEAEKQNEPILTPEEWKKSEYYREGLSFPDGVKPSLAALLAQRKDDERARQDIMRRATDLSFIQKASLFGVDFAAQALDPINIAAAYVPIVGEARALQWAEKYGRTAARLMIGGIEGTAGAALIEPIVYGQAKAEQADYDMYDSLMAVGFGGLFGAGLHAGLGKLGDVLGISQFAKDEAMRTAIGQLADGREVKVDPILRTDLKDNTLAPSDFEQPKRFYENSEASKIINEEYQNISKQPEIKTMIDNLNNDLEDMRQLAENKVISADEYKLLSDEVGVIQESNNRYADAVKAAASCLTRI